MDKAARFLLYCLVVWAPLPLASNRPIFWFINGVIACIILALFLAGEIARRPRAISWRPVAWIYGGLTVWVLWMIVQALPDAPAALRHPIWRTIADGLADTPDTISINPSATWTTIAQVVPAAFLTVVAMRLATNHRRARVLLNVIIATSVCVAALGWPPDISGFDRFSCSIRRHTPAT